jgi:hypothetical protein
MFFGGSNGLVFGMKRFGGLVVWWSGGLMDGLVDGLIDGLVV